MSAIIEKKHHFWKMGVVLFLSSLAVSASLYWPTPVSADLVIDPRRADMLSIADMYTNYTWTATETNLLDYPYPPGSFSLDSYGGYLYEPNTSTFKAINADGLISGIFPGANVKWEYIHNVAYEEVPGQIRYGAQVNTPDWIDVGQNTGIPYAWGMKTPIDGVPDNPATGPYIIPPSGSFVTRINAGLFAGNTDTTTDGNHLLTAGVDCVGLVENAWRLPSTTRYGMSRLKTEFSNPIKFRDLQPGDILMDEDDHVMLFEKFDPPLNGEPVAGTTFWVYEASGEVWKVRHHQYSLESDPALDNSGEEIATIGGLSYTPRTKFDLTPIDVVLVIDTSGSMEGSNIEYAQEAAKMFVDLMKPGDKLAIVGFSTTAYQVYPEPPAGQPRALQTIGSANYNVNDVVAAIDGLTTGGSTSIGDGLSFAAGDLYTYGTADGTPTGRPDPTRVIVLLSDGYGDGYENVSQLLTDHGIFVHTLGIGNFVDAALLKRIADEHGGEYQWTGSPFNPNNMMYALNAIREKIYGGNTIVAATPSQLVAAGATINGSILVDSAIGSMTLSFFKSESDVSLTLTQPNGNPIDINSPTVMYTSGSSYEVYTILAPQTGMWTTSVSSAGGGEYSLSVSTMDAMTFLVETEKNDYAPGEPIKFTASVNDSTSGSLLAAPQYVLGAIMQVTVEDPELNQFNFELYDDGQHADGDADDGIYANTFSDAVIGGVYHFNVHVSGNNNRDGLPFTRERILSVAVDTHPQVTGSEVADLYPPDTSSVSNSKSEKRRKIW